MRFTAHFTLEADFPSAIHAPPEVISAIRLLCEEVLEPLRAYVGRPVIVISGWSASKAHVPDSQHGRGEAADIDVPGMTSPEICRALLLSGARFDQAIWYDAPDHHLHVSFTRRRKLRGEGLHRTPETETGYTLANPPGVTRA